MKACQRGPCVCAASMIARNSASSESSARIVAIALPLVDAGGRRRCRQSSAPGFGEDRPQRNNDPSDHIRRAASLVKPVGERMHCGRRHGRQLGLADGRNDVQVCMFPVSRDRRGLKIRDIRNWQARARPPRPRSASWRPGYGRRREVRRRPSTEKPWPRVRWQSSSNGARRRRRSRAPCK